MKNLSAISKKGIIFISAMLILLAGGLVIGLPNSSDGCGHGDATGSYIASVIIPILNNTGQTLTISRLYIKVPDDCCTKSMHGSCKEWNDETRVTEIRFSDNNTFEDGDDTVVYTATSGNCCCSNANCNGATQTFSTNYNFSGTKVWCRVKLNMEGSTRPTGTYTVTYHFGFPTEDPNARNNTETFDL
ncbi:MAG: hypothetical protein KKI12_01940 [Proteobacteria bacterium]|nr:hypothetical protein [Pseudomonadota bacterium]MBU4415142.1 hypothetical protein [Pseudomonadota bacterium]MCG2758265.1 hypothetical protein [Desulfobacteraceae bacterium]